MSILTLGVRERGGDLLALVPVRQGEARRRVVVALGGVRGGYELCLFRVRVRRVTGGVCMSLVFVSRRVRGDRRETSLGGGLRDRVDHRVDGGARRYRGRRKRRRRR